MIEDHYSQLRRLISLLNSIGLAKDYQRVKDQAAYLNYFLSSKEPTPLERHKGIIELLEELPTLLGELRDRARRPDKKKRYDSMLASLKYGFPDLLSMWRYWDKSKAEIHAMLNNLMDWSRQVRYWKIVPQEAVRPTLFFAEISNAVDTNTPDGRFHLKVLKLLPKPSIEVEDYQELIKALEECAEEWQIVPMLPENKAKLEEILPKLDDYVTQLHVSSLLDI